jgi:hypothetical protein
LPALVMQRDGRIAMAQVEEGKARRAMMRFIGSCTIAACLLLISAMLLRKNADDAPMVLLSSSCIREMKPSCTIAVPGGKLHLTKIRFPNGLSNPGVAYATGVVNGQ